MSGYGPAVLRQNLCAQEDVNFVLHSMRMIQNWIDNYLEDYTWLLATLTFANLWYVGTGEPITVLIGLGLSAPFGTVYHQTLQQTYSSACLELP